MVDFYSKHNESAHRALSDCFATQACFEAMHEEVIGLYESEEAFLKTLK